MTRDLNYFVCTLGQATILHQNKEFETIPDFIELQARKSPNKSAVGFYIPGRKPNQNWQHKILTFRQIYRGVLATVEILQEVLNIPETQTIALLCPSSPAFLFAWLGLMQTGHPVLLVAPQCPPSAIAHLCQACDVNVIFHDDSYEDLAQKASQYASKLDNTYLKAQRLPFSNSEDVFESICRDCSREGRAYKMTETDIAYLHHTSGTSTGMPKPIPQSHRAGIGVLPLLNGSQYATFTTTPLYHGGVADLFRAWTSSALIWLFPGNEVSITASNIVKCLSIATDCAERDKCPPIQYFSSVPYVLQMMAQDERGLIQLQRMDIVGVGGAALPTEVGDRLVKQGVNLVSRFGSAECGFLLSSHRDYANDQAWQFLRIDPEVHHLKFERHHDGLAELVVLKGWPHMAKTNSEDGSYATSDLFEPHSDIPNAWRYHSRSDAQLTLITGKKFDPAPLENALTSSSPLIDDALIFGNGRPYPGVLGFKSLEAASKSDEEVLHQLVSNVEKMNKESQSHARILKHMIILMNHEESGLEKSSKGTVLRRKAEEKYSQQIENAYSNTMVDSHEHVPSSELMTTILKLVRGLVGAQDENQDELTEHTDLFSYGVDSITCMQIRHALSQLLPKGSPVLPLTVVEDSGTVSSLSNVIMRLRQGKEVTNDHDQDQVQLMQKLVGECCASIHPQHQPLPEELQQPINSSGQHKILLTGPTGSLGSHVLHQLLQNPAIDHIYLLIRGATAYAARERVDKALKARSFSIPPNFNSKCTILPCKLASPDLGLPATTYSTLATSVNTIIHLAWAVNFLQPLRSFTSTHLAGLSNLINLALSNPSRTPPNFIFCSSAASVSNYQSLCPGKTRPESSVTDPTVSGPTGYARSKWVAEQICLYAYEHTRLRNHMFVARVGQLSGARDTGVWSKSEAYPLTLSAMKVTGSLPDLDHIKHSSKGRKEVLNWLPVDLAAKAFVAAALQSAPGLSSVRSASSLNLTAGDNGEEIMLPVYHILSPYVHVTWSDLLRWLRKHESFEIVSSSEWLKKLRAMRNEGGDHPALRLLGFWESAYGESESGSEGSNESSEVNGNSTSHTTGNEHAYLSKASTSSSTDTAEESDRFRSTTHDASSAFTYETARTLRAMPCLKDIEPLNETYVMKLWAWIKENM